MAISKETKSTPKNKEKEPHGNTTGKVSKATAERAYGKQKKRFGKWGEDVAAMKLKKEGYVILKRNFRCRLGEIDIIAFDESTGELVFVEVKTRSELCYGLPCEAVNAEKQAHICRCAEAYIELYKLKDACCRMDIVEVLRQNGKVYVRHLKNCFSGG